MQMDVRKASIGGKWLELLKQIAPRIERAAMIFNPDTAPGHGKYYMPDFKAAAKALDVTPITAPVHSLDELEAAITDLGREPGGGFVAMADFFLLNNRTSMIALAAKNEVPAVYPWREVPTAGGRRSAFGGNPDAPLDLITCFFCLSTRSTQRVSQPGQLPTPDLEHVSHGSSRL
jgi:hypothetical protein